MTLKQLLHFAYEYCQDNWLFKECEDISNLTATWAYQDLKNEPLENLKIEKLPFSDGSCPEDWEEPEINPCRGCEDYDGQSGCRSNGGCGEIIEDHFISEEWGFNPYMGCYDWDN